MSLRSLASSTLFAVSMTLSITVVQFFTASSSSMAYAFPDEIPSNKNIDWEVGENQDYDFEGIVKLSNCSGSLFKFEGQPDSSKAYVLTNGHCVSKSFMGGMVRPGEVIFNKPYTRSLSVSNKDLVFFDLKATHIVYATMTTTDIGIYRLNQSYEQIWNKFKVSPYVLSSQHPSVLDSIEVISGYWERGYRCHIDGFVYLLREMGYEMNDSIRYSSSGCEVIGGTSGSPVVAQGQREIVGINNTGNDGGPQCGRNAPCEVDQQGQITSVPHGTYGQQTYQIYSCLNENFEINLTMAGCQLPRPL